jgi:LacI family transcriptional regulator
MNNAESPHRVTIRDIASELNLHFTTVAEALRNSHRISPKTRTLVKATAERMGYRPDPMLSALSVYRNQQRRYVFQGVLAWINNHSDQKFFTSGFGYYFDCFTGASERAIQYGYKLEEFWLGDRTLTIPRAVQILEARNISGLLVAPQPLGIECLDLPWDRFSAVKIGYSINDLHLPTVGPNQFQNTITVYKELTSRGYRRIGFACPKAVDLRVNQAFSGGYLSARTYDYDRVRDVPLFLDDDPLGSGDRFIQWIQENEPDAVMALPNTYKAYLDKQKAPRLKNIGFVSLGYNPMHHVSGMDENGKMVGSAAIDILVAQINHHTLGVSLIPPTTLIAGFFHDVGTIPSIVSKTPSL